MEGIHQCPACEYQLTLAEQRSKIEKCPSCDVFFAKVLARREGAGPVIARAAKAAPASKRGFKGLVVLGLLALLAYLYATPYLTVISLRAAAEARDAAAISDHVDYPALRQSLKDQLNSHMMVSMAKEMDDNPFAALGAAFASMMVDGLIEGLITPTGLANLMAGESIDEASESGGSSSSGSSADDRELFPGATMGYDGMSRFVVTAMNDSGETADFVFKRHGIFSWKLSEMVMPLPAH